MAITPTAFFEEETLTLTGDQTLGFPDGKRLLVTASGTNRDLTLPTADAAYWASGAECYITNVGSSNNVVVKNPDATTLDTLEPGEYGRYYNSNGTWYIGDSSNTSVGATDSDAIHDNVASEISAISAKATPVDADYLVIEDSAASNAKKSITLDQIRSAVNADDYTALTQTILDDGTSLTDDSGNSRLTWTANNATVGPSVSGGKIRTRLQYAGGKEGSYIQGAVPDTGPSLRDMSGHKVIKIDIETTIASIGGVWEFRTSSGADIATEADILDRFNLFTLPITGKAATFYFYLSTGTDDIQSLGIILTKVATEDNTTNTIEFDIDNVELPAMPKWWSAVLNNDNRVVVIPDSYTDATPDPEYVKVPSTVHVLDRRRPSYDPMIYVNHGDGTTNQWLMDYTRTTDVTSGMQHFHDNILDGDDVKFPRAAWYLNNNANDANQEGKQEAIGVRETRNFHIDYNGSTIYSPLKSRDSVIYTATRGAGARSKIENLRVMGYTTWTRNPGDGTAEINNGLTLTGGGNAVMTAQGDQWSHCNISHARVPQSDGSLKMEATFTWSATSAVTDDVEIYWCTEPGSDALSSALTHDGDITDDTVWSWQLSGSGTNEYYLRTAANAYPGDTFNFRQKPDAVTDAGGDLSDNSGSLGSLALGEWGWGDNDSLGNSHLYVRLSGSAANVDPGHIDNLGAVTYGGHFQDLDGPDLVSITNNSDWMRNTTTGMETRVTNNRTSQVRHALTGTKTGPSGGANTYWAAGDVLDLYQRCDDIEIYDGSGNLVVDSQGLPTTKVTPPTSSETWTIKASLPREITWRTPIHFRKLTGTANTITFTSLVDAQPQNQTDHDGGDAIQGSGISIGDANGLHLDNIWVEGVNGDGIANQGGQNNAVTITNLFVLGPRRHTVSTTESKNFRVQFAELYNPARSIFDIEPSSGPALETKFWDIICGGHDVAAGLGQLMSADAQNDTFGMNLQRWHVNNTSPGKNPATFADAGAKPSPTENIIAGYLKDIFFAARTKTSQWDGHYAYLEGMRNSLWKPDNGSAYNVFKDFVWQDYDLSGSTNLPNQLFDLYEDDGDYNLLMNAVMGIGKNADISADVNPFEPGYLTWKPVNIGSATGPELGVLYYAMMGRLYPNHYMGTHYMGSGPHFMGGLNNQREGIYNLGYISGSSTRRDGRNLNNNSAEITMGSAPTYAGTVHVVFPLRPDEPWTMGITDPRIQTLSGNVDGSGTLTTTTYYAKLAGGRARGGMEAPANTTGSSVTLTGSEDSILFGPRDLAGQAEIRAKMFIFYGTADGIYTHRFDVIPSLDLKGDWAPIYHQSWNMTLLGASITHPNGSGTNGWESSYSAQTGNVVTSTLTANDGDIDTTTATVPATSTTVACDDARTGANSFIALGVEPGYLFTNSTRSASATIKEVYPGHVVLDAAIAAQAATDSYTISKEWGQGGYQLSGGVMTYAANQFNDETRWEDDANYQAWVNVEVPHGTTFNYASYEVHEARWGMVIKFRDSSGNRVNPDGDVTIKIRIES